jgi:chemotaxis protein methyltransferase CheR
VGKRISDNLLKEFSGFIEVNMGLSFPEEKWAELEKGLQSVCKQYGSDNEETFARDAMSSALSKRQIEMLAAALTVGETYFFREKNSLDAFEYLVLSEWIRMRRDTDQRLRIWSAGCSSGEEPYSIAIILKMLLPDLKDWNISILATDINPHFLEKAVKGVYTSWSFRDVPERINSQFFIKKEGGFEILPEIKEMVTFSYLNLMKDEYPSLLNNTNAIDVIFCRNVLMYFSPVNIKTVVQKFHRCLTEGGLLVVSQTELNDEYFQGFGKVNHAGAMLFRKSDIRAEKKAYKPEIATRTAAPLYRQGMEEIKAFVIEKKTEIARKPAKKEAPPVVPAQDLYENARKAYEQGEYNNAEELLGSLLEGNSGNAKALSLMARVCANQGRLDDALRHIEEAIKADNMKPGYHYLHSAILKEKGLKLEAMASLKKAVYLDADFALAYFAMGNLALGSCNRVETERHFNNALLLLRKHGSDDILPESEGLTAGRLIDLIESMKWRKKDR